MSNGDFITYKVWSLSHVVQFDDWTLDYSICVSLNLLQTDMVKLLLETDPGSVLQFPRVYFGARGYSRNADSQSGLPESEGTASREFNSLNLSFNTAENSCN